MKDLSTKIESLLFVSYKPLSIKKLAELVEVEVDEVTRILQELAEQYIKDNRGWSLLLNNDRVQLTTAAASADLVKAYLQDETSGELTPASLETLTICAYRQPVSKAELEQIRGVNCSLILRNLMIRGLVEANYDKVKATTVYNVTIDFLKFLGIGSVTELPDYEKLNSDENLQKLLAGQINSDGPNETVVKVQVTKG